jgi:hypothetical protein
MQKWACFFAQEGKLIFGPIFKFHFPSHHLNVHQWFLNDTFIRFVSNVVESVHVNMWYQMHLPNSENQDTAKDA